MATEKESPGTGKLEEEEDQDKLVDTSEASEVGKSKKSKKRKKKKASKDQQTEPEGESVPSGEMNRGESVSFGKVKHTVITPTPNACFLCGTPRDRSANNGMEMIPPNLYEMPPGTVKGPLWACPRCHVGLEESSKLAIANARHGDNALHTLLQPSVSYVSSAAEECTCQVCTDKRETSRRSDGDIHTSQTYWMEVRNVVRCIYRDPTVMLNDPVSRATLTSSDMFVIVNRLCSNDPHQFFQRLETLTREYLLEVKVRLLEQLSLGYNTIPLAIKFIQMLVNEYSSLCKALPSLLLLLQPLDEENVVAKLGVTVELMNKNIFRELIFAETFMSSNLPLITAQLKLASLSSDPNNRKAADLLHQRYMALDQEMEEIGRMWDGAKGDLSKHAKQKKNHIQEMKDDAEVFRELRKTALQAGFTPPYHFHHFLSSSVSIFTVAPDTYTVVPGTLGQTFSIEVDVHKCSALHQALLDAPIRCMTVKGVELTLLDVFPHFGMKMDTSHVKLTEPPPPPKKKEPSGDGEGGQNGSEDLVSPVEETSRSLATVSPRTIHAIQSLIFKLVISADTSVEKDALQNGLVIPYTKNLSVTVTLKDVQMRSQQKFVNSSVKEYAIHEWGAVLSPCEKSNTVVFWDELQALWDHYRGEVPSSPSEPKADPPTQPKADTKDPSTTDKSGKRTDSGTSGEVKPLYELTLNGKCECSACISSMAARYTQDSFRLLDPTDPFGNQLELLDTGTGSTQSAKSVSGETLPKFPITTDVKGPLTCVHVANMGSGKNKTTSSGTQTPAISATRHDTYTTIDIHKPGTLIVSGLIKTHPNMFGHHHHHGNGSGDLGKDADAMETTLDSSKANHHHGFDSCCEHSHQTGTTATSSSCKSDSVSTANGNSSSHGNGTGSGTDSNTGDGSGSQKRYCRCCYCELFGPNGPPPVATSHNYRYYRERMRQKLEKKKDTTKPEEEETPSAISSGKSDQPTVEKLLEFIEGPQEEPKLSARAAKRQRRKQRKKGKGKKDGKGGDDGDDDEDDKWTASHEGSESEGEDSTGENEEIVEVQIPTQPLYSLDPIEDDDTVVQTKTPEPHAPPSRKADTPPLVNGDSNPARTEQAPLSTDTSSNGSSANHVPRQRSQQPNKSQFGQRAEGSRQVTPNGHPNWHGSSPAGKRSDLPHPQNKRSYGYSPQRENTGAVGNSEAQQYSSQRNVRSRPVQSFPSSRLHQLPPRFQRQAQEQMQSTQQQRPVAPRYQQRGGYSHHQHGHHSGQSILGNPPGEDVFLPGDEGDKEVEEFKRFCMSNTPMENRKKITASVNFKDLVAKK